MRDIFVFTLTILSLTGCQRPVHHHNAPAHHRVEQHISVPLHINQTHNYDESLELGIRPDISLKPKTPTLRATQGIKSGQ